MRDENALGADVDDRSVAVVDQASEVESTAVVLLGSSSVPA
jgi:hypothetical protein